MDKYPIHIIHFVNPHLLWVERKVASAASPIFEQIGLYALLPLESTIDQVKGALVTKRSSQWMPAASLRIHEALTDAEEVVFMPAFIDRRNSIFDDKIHKYGEIEIKKANDEIINLSQLLVLSNLAVLEDMTFHETLLSGNLHTKLSKYEIIQVFEAINAYYVKKMSGTGVRSQKPRYMDDKNFKNAAYLLDDQIQPAAGHKSTDVNLRPTAGRRSFKEKIRPTARHKSLAEKEVVVEKTVALTEENVAKFTRYSESKSTHGNFFDDIDEQSLGRASSRKKNRYGSTRTDQSDTQTSSCSSLQKRMEEVRRGLVKLSIFDKSPKNIPKSPIPTNSDEKNNLSAEKFTSNDDNYNLRGENSNVCDGNYNQRGEMYKMRGEKCNGSEEYDSYEWDVSDDGAKSNVTVSERSSSNRSLLKLVELKRKSILITEIKKAEPAQRDSAQMQGKFTTEKTYPKAQEKITPEETQDDFTSSPKTSGSYEVDTMQDNPKTEAETFKVYYNTESPSVAGATKKKAKKSGTVKPPPYNPKKERRVAYGPPEMDRKFLPLKVIPFEEETFQETLETQTPDKDEVVPRRDDFDGADSHVDFTLKKAARDEDVKRIPIKTQELGHNETKSGKSLLKKLVSLKNRGSNQSHSSDSSTKETYSDVGTPQKITEGTAHKNIEEKQAISKEEDEEEEEMAELLEKLNKEYSEETPIETTEVNAKNVEKTDLRNYANPFKNVDPNLSVFVDKLVTPVIMVHSASNTRFQPSFSMRDVCFDANLQLALKNKGIESPMNIQKLTWQCVLRGRSVFMVSPKEGGKTIGYLPAICKLLSIDLSTISNCLGPKCIIVCATAVSVADVEESANKFCGNTKKVIALYTGMTDIDMTTSLHNGCDMLVCTPSILYRLLKNSDSGIDLRRLASFVLDDSERLAQVYSTELIYFQRKIRDMLKNRIPKEFKVQYVVASREWHEFMLPLAKTAPDAVVCISAFQECVLYSKANTTASFVTKENKDKAVLDFLQQVDRSKKTVIVCRDDHEVEHLEKILTKSKYVVLACNSTMDIQELYSLSLTLNNYQDPVSGLILVCCDGNITHLNVIDAHHLIHYSLPNLFSMFSKRFAVLNENYASIFREENEEVKIKILIDNSNIEQLPKILHFIKRCTTSVPEALDEICEKVLEQKDIFKAQKLIPICDNMLALGECPDFWNCRERHAILKEYDEPKEWMPTAGEITFKILHYLTPTKYSARLSSNIVDGKQTKYPNTYSTLATKMTMYFATESNQRLHGIPQLGDICAVSVKSNFFVRCKVVKILSCYQSGKPNEVLIKLIDEEKLQQSRDIYLYHLPKEMKVTETHTIQVRLAGVQPKDKDITFAKLVSHHLQRITSQDEELYVKGRVALTIGNCVFVDTLVIWKDLKVVVLSKFSSSVPKHDLKEELLKRYAKTNPEHTQKLQNLCEKAQLKIQLRKPRKEVTEENAEISKPKKEMPKIQWAHLEKDEMTETIFTHAIDPGAFFVRLAKYDDLMKSLDDDIQKHVAETPVTMTDLTKGDVVLAKLPDDSYYERARIDDILEGNRVKCFYVDQGDWREVATTDLAPIPDKFVNRLPFQAIECRLFGVVSPGGGSWSDFANNWLTNQLQEDDGNPKWLYVKRFASETADYTGGRKYGVALIDTNTEQDVVINQDMVKAKLARRNSTEMKLIGELNFQGDTTNGSNDSIQGVTTKSDDYFQVPPDTQIDSDSFQGDSTIDSFQGDSTIEIDSFQGNSTIDIDSFQGDKTFGNGSLQGDSTIDIDSFQGDKTIGNGSFQGDSTIDNDFFQGDTKNENDNHSFPEDTKTGHDSEEKDYDWEKLSKPNDTAITPTVPLDNIFFKKPIRSVPLVGSDSDDENDDKWDFVMGPDVKAMLGSFITNQRKSPDCKINKSDTDDSISVISSPNLKNYESIPAENKVSSQSGSELTFSAVNHNQNNSQSNESELKSLKQIMPDKLEMPSSEDLKFCPGNLSINGCNVDDDSMVMKEISPVTGEIPADGKSIKAWDSDDLTSPEATELSLQTDDLNLFNEITQKLITKFSDNSHNLSIEKRPENIEKEIKKSEQIKELNKIEMLQEEPRKPKVYWSQTKTKITIKIQLICEEYDLKIEERNMKFNAYTNDTYYGFDIDLYGVIHTKESVHSNKGQYILVSLAKILAKNWLSLTKDLVIRKWLSYDLDSLDISSDEEEADVRDNVAKHYFNNKEFNDSDSEDDEFVDDVDFRYSK